MPAIRPSIQSSTSEPHPIKQIAQHLQVVFGVAFLLATLFTAWSPDDNQSSQPRSQTPPTQPNAGQPTGSPQPTTESSLIIGIVSGHWKNDSGAVCPDGTTEEKINQTIATLVQKRLAELGYVVDLLGEFDERLYGYKAAALVSIHADSCAYVNDLATGYKVAAAFGMVHPERAGRLTACLRDRYGKVTGLQLHSTSVTRDMTRYHAFTEIDENTPAAIIETGFMNLDFQILTQTPEIPAQGIIDGIICFLTNQSVPSPILQTTP